MCQFDVSRYFYPCHTSVYRLVRRCHQTIPHCRKMELRQKHIRKEEPCKHPEVCNWCCSMQGLAKDAVVEHWNKAKALHTESPALSMSEPAPEAKFVEYDGTTYYVSPSEFHHRILPTLLSEANAKKAMRESKAIKQDATGPLVMAVAPDWGKTPEKPAGGLEAVCFTANHVAQAKTPPIYNATMTNHGNTNAEPGQGNKSGTGCFIQPQYLSNQNPLSGQLAYEWKFSEGVDLQRRFIVAVNHRWNVQRFPERVIYQPWYTGINPQNPIYGGYRYPMYQQSNYFCWGISRRNLLLSVDRRPGYRGLRRVVATFI